MTLSVHSDKTYDKTQLSRIFFHLPPHFSDTMMVFIRCFFHVWTGCHSVCSRNIPLSESRLVRHLAKDEIPEPLPDEIRAHLRRAFKGQVLRLLSDGCLLVG